MASTSMAATAVFLPSAAVRTPRCSALPHLPSLRVLPTAITTSSKTNFVSCESKRGALLQVRATDESSPSVDAGELFTDLKEKWDAVDNKSTVILYGGGAIVAVWLSSVVVGAINSVPVLPKLMELVGLGYTGWFVYRYLLFKERVGYRYRISEEEDFWNRVICLCTYPL